MAKKNQSKKEKEMELFEAPVENKIEGEVVEMENQEVVNQEVETPVKNEMEMELEMDGEEIQGEMEELVAEKVKKEEQDNKEQKSKRGPKPGNKKEEKENKPEEKKEKALNLKDINIIQREIKKGRLAAPQARIEKTESGEYIMRLADGVIFPQDAKDSFKEIGKIAKMNDGKYVVTVEAAKALKTEVFKAMHENGEEVEHSYVRYELHKPGRDKDVVELKTVKEAMDYLNIQDAKTKKKEDEAKKKAEKDAKDKAEKDAKEIVAEDKKEEQTA